MKAIRNYVVALIIGLFFLTNAAGIIYFFSDSRLIALTDYEIHIFTESVQVSDEDVTEYIKKQLKDYVTPVDRQIIEEGFLALIDYSVFSESGALISSKKDQAGIIGSGFFGVDFEKHLVGCRTETQVVFDLVLDDDNNIASAGEKMTFQVWIHRTIEYVYPELTDEFVGKNLNYDSVESLIETAKEEIKQEKIYEAKKLLGKEVFSNVVENSKFYIKEKEIIQRFEEQVDYYSQMATYLGMDVYSYAYHVLHLEKNDFISFCKEESEYDIKSKIVAKRIAKKENIVITQDNIYDYCNNNDILYDGETPNEYLYDLVLIDEVMDFLVE